MIVRNKIAGVIDNESCSKPGTLWLWCRDHGRTWTGRSYCRGRSGGNGCSEVSKTFVKQVGHDLVSTLRRVAADDDANQTAAIAHRRGRKAEPRGVEKACFYTVQSLVPLQQ